MRSASSGDCHNDPHLALLCQVRAGGTHRTHSHILALLRESPTRASCISQDKMDLLCCENASVDLDMKCKSYMDPVLLRDDRVLLNLLCLEEKYMPNSRYFSCVQTDVEPRMRDSVAHWMLDVSMDESLISYYPLMALIHPTIPSPPLFTLCGCGISVQK